MRTEQLSTCSELALGELSLLEGVLGRVVIGTSCPVSPSECLNLRYALCLFV